MNKAEHEAVYRLRRLKKLLKMKSDQERKIYDKQYFDGSDGQLASEDANEKRRRMIYRDRAVAAMQKAEKNLNWIIRNK